MSRSTDRAREGGAPPVPIPRLEESPGPLDFPVERRITGAFRLPGRRGFAEGGAEGLTLVQLAAVRVEDGPRIPGAGVLEAVQTPLGLVRRLEVHGRVVTERIVVPRDVAACVLEWVAAEDAEIVVACTVEGPVPTGWRVLTRGLVMEQHGGAALVLAFSAAPEPLDVDARDPARPGVSARIRLRKDHPVRLAVVAGGDASDLRRALSSVDRIGALTRARRGRAVRLRGEGLSLEAPDAEAVHALEWARQELDAIGVGEEGAGRRAWRGLEALAAGEFLLAREALGLVGDALDLDRSPHPSRDLWAYLRLAGQYLAWTGDLATLRREWPRVERGYRAALSVASDDPLARPALSALAEAAESIGERGPAGFLREAAAGREGPRGREAVSGSPILRLVHDILGAEPDAPRGRLALRPDPPRRWDRFRVSGIAMGDARVALEYQCEDDRHVFALLQETGATPINLILEPALPGSILLGATVDGAPADLTARVQGDKLVIPLQVVLDHPRRVVLELNRRGTKERRPD